MAINSDLPKESKLVKKINFDHLSRTIDTYFSREGLEAKLQENRPLVIKYGVDLTAPFLHLGHAVNLWTMRHFQECGHKVIFLIGDFTTRIGDPTGRSEMRKIIPQTEIDKNAHYFIEQVKKILLTDESVFEIRRNSEWYDKMSAADFLQLTSMITHAKLIQREMFQKRISDSQEIHISEMMYPILQGYDSVVLKSDLTIVGSDQLFNENIGRFYQSKFGVSQQVIITTKITPGIFGKEKQSKSLGNYIALEDSPRDKFGKILSISDDLIFDYFKVYTTVDLNDIQNMQKAVESGNENPMLAKKLLAEAVVERYHGKAIALEELDWFNNVFSNRNTPSDIPVHEISPKEEFFSILRRCLPNHSSSALRRLLQQDAISLDGEKVPETCKVIDIQEGAILKIGKKYWFKLMYKP
ncbi:MAG: tyrosyl-tRNA synthetase, tyrosyl-tRNA synthetase [Francisellaceae bacterium]|nr:tyrosyl-tRNA synthetase, tyrosyl-tRNA synthetase [Francisellaceae bacterium]